MRNRHVLGLILSAAIVTLSGSASAKEADDSIPEAPPPDFQANETENAAKTNAADTKKEQANVPEAEERETLEKPRQITMVRWFQKLTQRNEEKQQEAVQTILKYKRWTGPEIRRNLGHYPLKRRKAVLPVLHNMKTVDAQYALAGRAIYDKDQEVRLMAAEAVRQMGGITAKRLILAKAFDEDERVREKVARALCNIRDPAYIDHLIPQTLKYMAAIGQGGTAVHFNHDHVERMDTTEMRAYRNGQLVERLPIDLPTVSRVKVKTYVPVLCTVLRREPDNLDGIAKWWKKHRDTFDWPNLEDDD